MSSGNTRAKTSLIDEAPARARGVFKRYGPVVVLTMASQVFSAGSTFVLPALGLATADLYAAATQMGLASLTGVVIGVVYNLAIGRPGFKRWGSWAAVAAVFSLVIACVLFVLLTNQGFFNKVSEGSGAMVLGAFGIGGAALSAAGVAAVRQAVLGHPRLLAGITVGPNAALFLTVGVLALVANAVDQIVVEVIPAVGWAVASLVVLAIALRGARTRTVSIPRDAPQHASTLQAAALAVGVITSSVLPSFYMAAVGSLAIGIPYLLYLSTKLGNTFVSLGVNSVLVVQYNWLEPHRPRLRLPETLTAVALALVCISGLVHLLPGLSILGSYLTFGMSWLCLIVAGALVIRAVNAERQAKLLLVKVIIDLAFSICIAFALTMHPTVTGYFAAFMASQGVTLAVGGFGLRSRTLPWLGALATMAALIVAAVGW